MRDAIGEYYDLYAGKSGGLTVGMLFGKSIVWRELLLVNSYGGIPMLLWNA